MRRIVCCLLSATLGLLLPSVCPAQSMWQNRDPSKVFLFSDTEARSVGDLITIVIQEDTDVKNRDDRQLKKDTQSNALFDFNGSTSGAVGEGTAAANFDSNLASNRKFNGSTKFSSDRAFTDRVTVVVLDVQPNGNLVVAGNRQVAVAGDTRTLVVSGIVRPVDVQPDNSVRSPFVANFRMNYEGAGVEPVFTNQGWLGRIGNTLWPF